MSNKKSQPKELAQIARESITLGAEGLELEGGLWENGVYLRNDGFVYHLIARQARGRVTIRVEGKRAVGEYLRWVDGLFNPGELPTASNGVHYRAARKLRELI